MWTIDAQRNSEKSKKILYRSALFLVQISMFNWDMSSIYKVVCMKFCFITCRPSYIFEWCSIETGTKNCYCNAYFQRNCPEFTWEVTGLETNVDMKFGPIMCITSYIFWWCKIGILTRPWVLMYEKSNILYKIFFRISNP